MNKARGRLYEIFIIILTGLVVSCALLSQNNSIWTLRPAYGFSVFEDNTFYFDPETHVLAKGEMEIDGDWYLFNQTDGAMYIGFYEDEDHVGTVYYYDDNGKKAFGQRRIDGAWYMFDLATGKMVTGFFNHTQDTNPGGGVKTCYYDDDGRMVYGQKHIDGNWYYFSPDSGAMYTGFKFFEFQDKTVYYDESGQMVYGEKDINGFHYTFAEGTGALISKVRIE